MHRDIFNNPWELGRESFGKKDIVAIRAEAARRRKQKSDVRKCILNGISEADKLNNERTVQVDVSGLPPWQQYTRSVPNNLDLH